MKILKQLSFGTAIYSLALALSLFFCVATARQNRQLTATIHEMGGSLAGTARAIVGDIVPSFAAHDVQGNLEKIEYGAKNPHRLVFINSQNCGACRASAAVWDRLVAESLANQIVPVSMNIDGESIRPVSAQVATRGYVEVLLPSGALQRAYRVTEIPLFMLISPLGEVEWVRYGTLDPSSLQELNRKIVHMRTDAESSRL